MRRRHFEVLRSIQTKRAFSVFKDGPVPLKPLSATHRLRSLHYFANPNAHSLYPHRETKNETLPWAPLSRRVGHTTWTKPSYTRQALPFRQHLSEFGMSSVRSPKHFHRRDGDPRQPAFRPLLGGICCASPTQLAF